MRRKAVDVDTIILDLWRATCHGQIYARRAVAEAFAHTQNLTDSQREIIVSTLYGMLGQARRIEHALCPGGGRLPARTSRALAQMLAYRVLTEQLLPAAAQALLPAVDWTAVAAADAAVAAETDPIKRLGVQASLPDCLAERIVAEFGGEAEALARALNQRAPLTLRVNTLKATRQAVLGRLSKAGLAVRPTRFAATGIEIETHTNVFALPEFADGTVEVQDEASQLVAALVAPPPHGLVVDYCAGAGGKALSLGALMRNQGRLLALDVNRGRLDEFRRRARRAGLANARAILLDAGGEWPAELRPFAGSADRVLVDAPCSGIGAFRRRPDMRWRLQTDDLARLPREQEAIARRAMQLCAPGGRLIYATCSVLAEENQQVVERLLRDAAFELVPVKEIMGKAVAARIADSSGRFLTLLPHRHGTDGFFAAVLRRKRRA